MAAHPGLQMGSTLHFHPDLPGARDIYAMNANGSGLRNITNTPNADEDFPEWSPKGNDIIFSSNRDGNHEIYITNLGGKSTHKANLWITR